MYARRSGKNENENSHQSTHRNQHSHRESPHRNSRKRRIIKICQRLPDIGTLLRIWVVLIEVNGHTAEARFLHFGRHDCLSTCTPGGWMKVTREVDVSSTLTEVQKRKPCQASERASKQTGEDEPEKDTSRYIKQTDVYTKRRGVAE